jgi:hypothetical protein
MRSFYKAILLLGLALFLLPGTIRVTHVMGVFNTYLKEGYRQNAVMPQNDSCQMSVKP